MFFLFIYTLVGGKVSFAFRGFCGDFCVCQCRRVITYEKKMSSVASCSACSRGGVKNYKKRRHFVALSLFWCACSLFALHAGQLIRRCLLTSFKFTKKHSARTQGRNFHFFSPKSVDTSRLKSCDARLVDLKGKLVVNALLLQCFFFFHRSWVFFLFFFFGQVSFSFVWKQVLCWPRTLLLFDVHVDVFGRHTQTHIQTALLRRGEKGLFFSHFFL